MIVAIIVVAMVLTFLFHKTGFLTKTEDSIGHAQQNSRLKEASEGLQFMQNQRFLLSQQRLLAHLLAKLNRLAKQQILSSHQVSWDKAS